MRSSFASHTKFPIFTSFHFKLWAIWKNIGTINYNNDAEKNYHKNDEYREQLLGAYSAPAQLEVFYGYFPTDPFQSPFAMQMLFSLPLRGDSEGQSGPETVASMLLEHTGSWAIK